ncbi:hypothetical protein ABH999_006949 [Bradyrhizobium yuanmingense]
MMITAVPIGLTQHSAPDLTRSKPESVGPVNPLVRQMRSCSPDGAQRNPGESRPRCTVPDYAPLHPGYALSRKGDQESLRPIRPRWVKPNPAEYFRP